MIPLLLCFVSRKSLLTEGLKFLMDVYHLFPPIDEVRGRERAEQLRRQAVEVSTSIIEELLSSLPLGVLEMEGDISGGNSLVEDLSDIAAHHLATNQGVETVEGVESVEQEVEPVTDEERLADREIRLSIYLGLLNLACAMVGHWQTLCSQYTLYGPFSRISF